MTKAELLEKIKDFKDTDIIGFYEKGYDYEGWAVMRRKDITEVRKEKKEYSIYKD